MSTINDGETLRVGYFANAYSPPANYRCGLDYLRELAACTAKIPKSQPWSTCLIEADRRCQPPGPGSYVELLAFLLVAGKLKFEVRFLPQTFSSEHIKLLANDTIDIDAERHTMTAERLKLVKFSVSPFSQGAGRSGVVLRKDAQFTFDTTTRFWSFLYPLQFNVWLSILLAFVVSAAFFAIVEHVQRKPKVQVTVANSLWFTFVHLAADTFSLAKHEAQQNGYAVGKRSAKVVVLIFATFAFIVQSLYGNLIATSSVQPQVPQPRFRTLLEYADLILTQGYRLADNSIPNSFYDKVATSSEANFQLMKKALSVHPSRGYTNSTKAVEDLLANPKLAFLFVSSGGVQDKFADFTRNSAACAALSVQTFEDVGLEYSAFATNPRHGDLVERLSRLIEENHALVDMLEEKYNLRGKCVSSSVELQSTILSPISAREISGSMTFLLICHAICGIAFMLEACVFKPSRKIRRDQLELGRRVAGVGGLMVDWTLD